MRLLLTFNVITIFLLSVSQLIYLGMLPLKQKVFNRHSLAPSFIAQSTRHVFWLFYDEAFRYKESVKPWTIGSREGLQDLHIWLWTITQVKLNHILI